MTLMLAVNSPDSIWMLADRRLSCGSRVVRDDACKIMFLETTDGIAILGYAGLGATAAGTQPSDWMSAVLRGRNMPLEHCLSVLAEAMKAQLPRHMTRMPKESNASHHMIVTAFVDSKPRMYTIDLLLSPDRKQVGFRFLRHETPNPPRPPRFIVGGSGESHLLPNYRPWYRLPLRAIRAVDRKKASPVAVGRVLAQINYETSIAKGTIGPDCIVGWRYRKGGGGYFCYKGTTLGGNASPPSIGKGFDWKAFGQVMLPHAQKLFEAMESGGPARDTKAMEKELNAAIARLPRKPDERLR